MSKKIGIIGIPGKWSSETLADAVEKETGFRLLINMDDVSIDVNKQLVRYQGYDLTALDGIIVKKLALVYEPQIMNRLEILRFLESAGVPIFSKPGSIGKLLNRLNCTTALCQGGIPMPPTVITENIGDAHQALVRFGTAVLKPLFSSKARGMKVITDSANALDELQEFKQNGNQTIYIQKYFTLPDKDLGLVFLGGKYLATYARVRQNDSWNTTTHSGGKYERVYPKEHLIEIAKKAQSLFDLDFTCVDLAETSMGPIIFEVSAFGGFRGLANTHNINAAELLTAHALKRIN